MFRAPRPANLPHLHTMVDNIGYSPVAIGRYLDLSVRTVQKYIDQGQAPRPVMLALFWESTWGMSAANADAINQARMLFSENSILKRQLAKQDQVIALLERELDSRSLASNSPFFNAK